MGNLRDRVAVVTGGSSGIGAACVHRLIDDGAFVIVAGRDEKRTQAVCESSSSPERAFPVLGDICDLSDCDRIIQTAFDHHGRVDILVNAAGVHLYKPFVDVSESDWDTCIDTNLKGACFIMQAALRRMVPCKRGVIVNITSIAGQIGLEKEHVYVASKAGLDMLTRSLAKELGPERIRLINVAPGVIESPMTVEWVNANTETAPLGSLKEHYPLRRFGKPDEVAAVVSFLASDEADWVTGCSWNIDGGLLA